MEEEWKIIPGYEDYMVSNIGSVKSLKHGKERILKPRKSSKGYLRVTLCNVSQKTIFIHQLVAMAFLGHKLNGYTNIIDHINNNRLDNRVENLQITTNRENCSKDRKNKTSIYTGVHFHKQSKKWASHIWIVNEQVHLGYFDNEIEAYNAYLTKLNEIDENIKNKTDKF